MAENTKAEASKLGIHHLKCWPQYFEPVYRGDKNFEIRFNDRGYRVGDKIVLHEWVPKLGKDRVAEGYTGRDIEGTVTCVVDALDSSGLADGYVALGVAWKHFNG